MKCAAAVHIPAHRVDCRSVLPEMLTDEADLP